jgi:hypothetical protein
MSSKFSFATEFSSHFEDDKPVSFFIHNDSAVLKHVKLVHLSKKQKMPSPKMFQKVYDRMTAVVGSRHNKNAVPEFISSHPDLTKFIKREFSDSGGNKTKMVRLFKQMIQKILDENGLVVMKVGTKQYFDFVEKHGWTGLRELCGHRNENDKPFEDDESVFVPGEIFGSTVGQQLIDLHKNNHHVFVLVEKDKALGFISVKNANVSDLKIRTIDGEHLNLTTTKNLEISYLCASEKSYVTLDKKYKIRKLFPLPGGKYFVTVEKNNKFEDTIVDEKKIVQRKTKLAYGKLMIIYALVQFMNKGYRNIFLAPARVGFHHKNKFKDYFNSELAAYYHLNFGFQRMVPVDFLSPTISRLWFTGFSNSNGIVVSPEKEDKLWSNPNNRTLYRLEGIENVETTTKIEYAMLRPFPSARELWFMFSLIL